jgi:hypothetical protein
VPYTVPQVPAVTCDIIAVPAETPDTTPPVVVTDATLGALLTHVPPAKNEVSVIELPTHTADVPETVSG